MRFRNRETDLERELRAQRPQPREQFVHMLSGRPSPASKPARTGVPGRIAPRIVLVAVVTLVLAASLGVTGALGHAGSSLQSFGASLYHVVDSPHYSADHESGDPRDDGDPGGELPFHREYDHFVPICHDLHITYVPSFLFAPLLAFSLTHGGHWTAPFHNPLRCTA